ncbi:MAG: hypothetical protein HY007_02170 [Candidatus Sungbacteria bacterium]|nr:hypothetical protein [Candidatus Sungbacteria bacterium]
MRKFWYVFSLAVISGFVIYAFGLYPVALVNGTPIFARTWTRTLDAEKRVVNVRAYASHAELVDFSSPKNARLLDAIRKNTLTFLVDSVLMNAEGSRVVPDLEQLSMHRVNDELGRNQVTEQTASAVYGLDLATLKEMVLMPQARQEVLDQTLAAEQKNFGDWLRGARGRAKVRFFFVPFTWDREGIK